MTASLSARRAWIEIASKYARSFVTSVALRKESVDRNADAMLYAQNSNTSLSARRAWIEIGSLVIFSNTDSVALRKESVDRNSVSTL